MTFVRNIMRVFIKAIPFLISANPVVEIPLELVEVDLLYDPLLFAALTH